MLSHLLRLYTYNAWANGLLLEKLKSMETPIESITKFYSHILATEKLWMYRIQGLDTSKIEVWPNLSTNVIDKHTFDNRRMINDFLSNLKESDLDTEITYTNTSGTEYHTPLKDILIHLAMHGNYHRGQIAREMRRIYIEPVNTDFITFVRSGG
ncbi:MAG: DinB family protein [Candidatus Paceibacterota bacterium]